METKPHSVLHIIRMESAGGGTMAPLRLAQAEMAAGRRARVFCVIERQFDVVSANAAECGVRVNRMKIPRLMLELLKTRMLGSRLDVVHMHSGLNHISPKVRLVRRLLAARIPLIVWLHGPGDLERMEDPKAIEEHQEGSRSAAVVVVPSEAERRRQVQLGIPPEKLFAIPIIIQVSKAQRGLARGRLGLDADAPILLFCGRLAEEKNPLTACRAFRQILQQYPRAALIIAGDGPLADACKKEVEGLGGRVHFLGHVANTGELYADADILLAPSSAESFGMSALEAAYAKVPVVLGRIRPWCEMLRDGAECEFVDPESPAEMSAAILRLLGDRKRAAAMAEAAYEVVQRTCTAEAVRASLDKMYSHIWNARRP